MKNYEFPLWATLRIHGPDGYIEFEYIFLRETPSAYFDRTGRKYIKPNHRRAGSSSNDHMKKYGPTHRDDNQKESCVNFSELINVHKVSDDVITGWVKMPLQTEPVSIDRVIVREVK
jgi:hypothetical protein